MGADTMSPPQSSPQPLVRVDGLVKYFGSVRALDSLSFDVKAGEVHGFIGPNGAGKTTAMRIIAGVETPDAGDVRIGGQSILGHPELCRSRVGFMPDYLDSYPGILVWEYLDFYGRIYGLPPKARRERQQNVVAFTGLGEMRLRPVSGLSKGWLQRLSLARVLLNDPALLVLDEPAAGLDPRARIELRDMVMQLAAHGKAVFLSSHILGELSEMCTAVTIIDGGRRLAGGPMDDLRRRVDNGHRVAVRLARPDGIDGAENRRLALFLAGLPGVSGAECTLDGAQFTFDGDADFKAGALARLVADGFRITDFHSVTSSLEDAFMAVTGAVTGAGPGVGTGERHDG